MHINRFVESDRNSLSLFSTINLSRSSSLCVAVANPDPWTSSIANRDPGIFRLLTVANPDPWTSSIANRDPGILSFTVANPDPWVFPIANRDPGILSLFTVANLDPWVFPIANCDPGIFSLVGKGGMNNLKWELCLVVLLCEVKPIAVILLPLTFVTRWVSLL